MSIWTDAKLQPVFHPAGNFYKGAPRRVRAPFTLVELNGVTYVNPLGSSLGQDDLHGGAAAVEDPELLRQARNGFGYFGDSILIEEHVCGDGADTIFGLHKFGYL